MRLHDSLLLLPVLFATLLPAQTQLVRGDVDRVQNTANDFRLACTNIRLVSQTVSLKQLHDASRQQDIEYEMQVRDVSTGGQTVLDVVSARQIPEMFGMGNLRIGRADTWDVVGTPGSPAAMFVTIPSMVGYAPLGSAGTWLVGPSAVLFAIGKVSALGRFQVRFQPPDLPGLVGQTIVGQGVLIERGALVLANADCKEVRAR